MKQHTLSRFKSIGVAKSHRASSVQLWNSVTLSGMRIQQRFFFNPRSGGAPFISGKNTVQSTDVYEGVISPGHTDKRDSLGNVRREMLE